MKDETMPDVNVIPPKFDVITNMPPASDAVWQFEIDGERDAPPACPKNVDIKSVSDAVMLAIGVFALLGGGAAVTYILWMISNFNWLTTTS